MSTALGSLSEKYSLAVEAELLDLLTFDGHPFGEYYGMLHYHMGWVDAELNPINGHVGKRVRPLLCLLACEAAGGSIEQSLPAAAGIEALHNFSLLHDDIEDSSEARRGRPTVWKIWGQAQAINAGDGLFSLAHLAFARLPQRGVSIDRTVCAMRVFAETCLALTHGQHLDMRFEDRLDVTVKEYLTMIEGKTAALVAASSYLGAYLGGADERTAGYYREFGRHLGLAFQVQDDILGIWGDSGITGKSISGDIETRKKTLPVVYGLERLPELRQLYATGAVPQDQVAWVAELLDGSGARRMAEAVAREHHALAMCALEQSGAHGLAEMALKELASNVLTRSS